MQSNYSSDQSQRDTALDTENSFIIQAPAGSGKTELLTQRFLKLLSSVDQPQKVLAVTFTRKATREMGERVLARIRQAAGDTPPSSAHEQIAYGFACAALAQDRKFGWGLGTDPVRLQNRSTRRDDSECEDHEEQRHDENGTAFATINSW